MSFGNNTFVKCGVDNSLGYRRPLTLPSLRFLQPSVHMEYVQFSRPWPGVLLMNKFSDTSRLLALLQPLAPAFCHCHSPASAAMRYQIPLEQFLSAPRYASYPERQHFYPVSTPQISFLAVLPSFDGLLLLPQATCTSCSFDVRSDYRGRLS